MSFIPENTPFVSLPTALKGRISPHQLAVLWVLQSYYPNIWPSYSTIAKDAGMCRTKVIHTVEQLVSLGWLQKINRVDENGKKTQDARATVRHNGYVVHDDVAIPRPTAGGKDESEEAGGIMLHYHGNPVQFRNIWVVPK